MVTVVRRLAGALLTLVLTAAVIFFALKAGQGDPTTQLLGSAESIDPERIAEVRARFGLDQPLLVQFASWFGHAITFDFGTSYSYRLPVTSLIGSRLGVTLSLAAFASVLFVVIGLLLGMVSALRQGRRADTLIVGLTTFAASVPGFVVGLVLVTVFSIQLGWFPVSGGGQGFLGRLGHLTLPAVSLAVASIATISRVTRQTMVEQAAADHVEAAVVNGLPRGLMIRRHILRNSWPPIITMVGLSAAGLLAGTVIIERVFGISGIGSMLVDGISTNDQPVVMAVLLLMVAAFIVVTMIVEFVNAALDPRLKSKGQPA